MPLALLAALAGSLAIHLTALFGTHIEPFAEEPEPIVLQAELKPLPVPPPAASEKPKPKAAKKIRKPAHSEPVPVPAPEVPPPDEATPEQPPAGDASTEDSTREEAKEAAATPSEPAPTPPPAQPVLPARGAIRYAVSLGTGGFVVGRAEHRWEFTEDGHYRLHGITETTGLVALFKTMRFENESVGRLTAHGLEPETYRTLKNGRDGKESADFDWSTAVVHLARDGSVREVAPGTQDILSLNYQLAYLPKPERGASIGVVTGKKYERYALDSLGEESLETPAGVFRTLHLRAATDSVTEIWIALDLYRLPVKIRFTDKKGDTLEQVATELGSLAEPAPAATPGNP